MRQSPSSTRHLLQVALGGCLSLSLAACGATGDEGDTNGGGGAAGFTEHPTVVQKPSAGCGASGLPADGEQSLTVGGVERTYLVSLPDAYQATQPYPLIFAFHGLGNDGEGVSNPWYFGIEQKGGTPSIFVYPDGLEDIGGTGWPNSEGRDIAFFDAMLETIGANYCIDENRVFSTGHSYGGIMTFTLACERAAQLRAVAPVAGARWARNDCTSPIATWGAHGNPDEVVSYELGVAAMSRILEANSCEAGATAPSGLAAQCLSYSCEAGYPTTWCEHQQGHDWPDFAAQSIKDFFDSF